MSPLLLVLKAFSFYLFACPCLVSARVRGGCCIKTIACYFHCCGIFTAIPFIIIFIIVLLYAAFVAANNLTGLAQCADRIAVYAYKVHVVSAGMDILMTLKNYLDGRTYVKISCCGISLIVMGRYFLEKSQYMEKDIDYTDIRAERFGGSVQIFSRFQIFPLKCDRTENAVWEVSSNESEPESFHEVAFNSSPKVPSNKIMPQ